MRVRWIESQTVRESPVGCGTSWLRITYMAMSETSEHLPSRSKFPTTAWSMVVKAGNPQSQLFKESLARLCSSYWYPVFVFIKGKGFKSEEARDYTQEFFARVIEKQYLAGLDRSKGRFRSFILASVTHFLSNRLDAQRTPYGQKTRSYSKRGFSAALSEWAGQR